MQKPNLMKFIPVLTLFCIIGHATGFAQNQYAWKGTLTLKPEFQEPFDGGFYLHRATTLSIMLINGKKDSWFLNYHLVQSDGLLINENITIKGNNEAKDDNTFLFKNTILDSLIQVEGKLLPDGSAIQSQIQFNGKNYGELTLKKINNWSGDTTINNKLFEVAVFDDGDWRELDIRAKYDNTPLQLTTGSYAGESIDVKIVGSDLLPSFSNYGLLIPENSSQRFFQLFDKDGNVHQFALHNNRPYDLLIEKDAGETIGFNQILLGFLVFLIVLIALYYLLYKKRNKDYIISNMIQTDVNEDWLEKILPIVRVGVDRSFFKKARVWVIQNNGMYIYKKGSRKNIESLHNLASSNNKETDSYLKINWEDVQTIEVEKESAIGKVRIRIHHSNGLERITLPGFEISNIVTAFHLLVGSKLQTDLPIRIHHYQIWIKIFLATFCSYILLVAPGIFRNLFFNGFATYIAYLLLTYAIIKSLFTFQWLEDQLARNKQKEIRKLQKDQSHHKPFRSVLVSFLLKLTGGFILFYCILLHLNDSYLLHKLDFMFSEMIQTEKTIISVIGYFIAGLMLSLALALANRDPKKISDDKAKPILYLRSFLDDRETSFQPGTWLSSWMGVDPPYYQMNRYRFVADSKWVKWYKKILKYFYNNHPVRLIRILFSWPVDTSEQQLELYFRNKNAFVAIGKPGEKIITSGANRMYVTNEEWQDVVLDYLNRSQLVVLQPNSTEGVWWEIGKSVELVEPERLFYCMMNFRNRQNDYENFRIRFEALRTDITIPRFIGNSEGIYFFRFKANWQLECVQLKYRKWYTWPFVGNAADLESTLKG